MVKIVDYKMSESGVFVISIKIDDSPLERKIRVNPVPPMGKRKQGATYFKPSFQVKLKISQMRHGGQSLDGVTQERLFQRIMSVYEKAIG